MSKKRPLYSARLVPRAQRVDPMVSICSLHSLKRRHFEFRMEAELLITHIARPITQQHALGICIEGFLLETHF